MSESAATTPSLRDTAVRSAWLLLGFAVVVALCALLEVRLGWLVTGMAMVALFVVWCVLLVRSLIRLGRALGLRRGLAPACLNAFAVVVLVPVVFVGLSRLPVFFWWHRTEFDEATTKAEQGQFAIETFGHHSRLRLPPRFEGLSVGGKAWIIESGDRRHVVFVTATFHGESMGFCRIPDRKPPGEPYHSRPLSGTDGRWFSISLD